MRCKDLWINTECAKRLVDLANKYRRLHKDIIGSVIEYDRLRVGLVYIEVRL